MPPRAGGWQPAVLFCQPLLQKEIKGLAALGIFLDQELVALGSYLHQGLAAHA